MSGDFIKRSALYIMPGPFMSAGFDVHGYSLPMENCIQVKKVRFLSKIKLIFNRVKKIMWQFNFYQLGVKRVL